MRLAWMSFDSVGRDCLEAASAAGADVAAVVTLPGPIDPNRAGQCAFDEVAARLGAPLIETLDVNAPETVAAVVETSPDTIFVVGWSQLVHEGLIGAAPKGVFGMHPSLLPRHRGRAPIPWAILSGLATTGVTLFEIVDPTADSGPIVGQLEISVARAETATSLYDKVAEAHVELVRRYVPLLAEGRAPRSPQDPARSSSWPKRTPLDGIIDWHTRAPYLDDWVRAQTRPYPGAFTFAGDAKLTVWRARALAAEAPHPAGEVVERRPEGPVVACGEGALLLEEVEPPALAERIGVGDVLG